jgi:hypothetical protein
MTFCSSTPTQAYTSLAPWVERFNSGMRTGGGSKVRRQLLLAALIVGACGMFRAPVARAVSSEGHVGSTSTGIPTAVPIGTGQGASAPRLSEAVYGLEAGRWVRTRALALNQPVLFTLAAQAGIPGWRGLRGEVRLLKAVRRRPGAPLQPDTRVTLHVAMHSGSEGHGYVHFWLRRTFTSRSMVGPYFVEFILRRAGGYESHLQLLAIHSTGK